VRQETPSTGDQFLARIQVLDVASGNIRSLTGETMLEGYPVVSPDGSRVAYWRNRDAQPWTIKTFGWRPSRAVRVVISVQRSIRTCLSLDGHQTAIGCWSVAIWKDDHVTTEFYAIPVHGHFPSDPVRQMDVYERWINWLVPYLK
jgi:hypothetical protein